MSELGLTTMLPGRSGKRDGAPGLRVRRHTSTLLASVIARRDGATALAAATHSRFGVDLPHTPRWVASRNVNIIWNGPSHWLVESSDPAMKFEAVASGFGGGAAVVDQTASRIMLDVSGPRVRDVLAKGLPIDLHETRFQVGDVALTSASHIGVLIWQTELRPVYRVAIARSYFASFWHWLAASAAEFGCEVSP